LPVDHEIGEQGFLARWQVNQFSSDIISRARLCSAGQCSSLMAAAFGVALIDPVDAYLQSERATKYALLFVGLSFIGFFLFEVTRELRVHPIHYTLVGLAISVFYLLLLSLSEHIRFTAAYTLAAIGCIGLLAYYVNSILPGWAGTGLFTGTLSTLYGVLFVIIQAERN
jgi:inner membrane protein